MGACFSNYYYNWDTDDSEHFYPSDVDDYAEHYFGTERYNSEEFQDEAYMFVPFDEEYYQGLSKYIDRAFSDFLPDFTEYCAKTDKETAEKAEKLLGLKLTLPRQDEQIAKAYRDIEYMSKASGGCALPMIIDLGGCADTQDDVSDLLLDATDTFLETVVIANFTSDDPVNWTEKNFGGEKFSVIPSNDRIASLQSTLADMFGAVPAILTFDEESATLLIPLENGVYIRFAK